MQLPHGATKYLQLMGIAAFVISCIAVLISLWAGWNAFLSRRAAQTSAEAADVTVKERRFRWSVTRCDDQEFTVRNEGTVTALDVSITAGAMREKALRDADRLDLGPGEAVNFVALGAWGSPVLDFIINWTPNLPDAKRRTWTEPCPPKAK